jgi:hypothetical protein
MEVVEYQARLIGDALVSMYLQSLLELFERKVIELPCARGISELAERNLYLPKKHVLNDVKEGGRAFVEHLDPLL